MRRLFMPSKAGDLRVHVRWPQVCQIGEIVILGNREARTLISKGSLPSLQGHGGEDHGRG